MKLTPIENVKAGDYIRAKDGRIHKAEAGIRGSCRGCDGCPHGLVICGDLIFKLIPTVRVLEETARAFRDRLAQEVVSAEVNGGRADREVYDMLAELETLVGPASVRM